MKNLLSVFFLTLFILFSCAACSRQQEVQNSQSSFEDNAETLDVDALLAEMTAETTEPSTPQSGHYVLNTNTKKFHSPDCPSVSDMKEKNKREFEGSRNEVIAQGYQPCQRCNP